MNSEEFRNWAKAYKGKNSYQILSKEDQKVIDSLIAREQAALEIVIREELPSTKNTPSTLQPSAEGVELIRKYVLAEREIRRKESELNVAKTNSLNAQIAVAKWLKPKDAKEDETFHMWYGDSLFAITNESVSIRQRGNSLIIL